MSDRDRALQAYLETFLTPERDRRLREVLSRRTRKLTLVLDNVHQSHNISAVLRSCDAFGIQDVHVIEVTARFEVAADIAAGATKWLTIHRHAGPTAFRDCAERLKAAGYRLVVTQPGPQGEGDTLETLDVTRPTALVLGNESVGISPEMLQHADGSVRIPMAGFVESLNLSVAAALCLYNLTRRIRSGPDDWKLPDDVRADLHFQWIRRSIPNVRQIENRWEETNGSGS